MRNSLRLRCVESISSFGTCVGGLFLLSVGVHPRPPSAESEFGSIFARLMKDGDRRFEAVARWRPDDSSRHTGCGNTRYMIGVAFLGILWAGR